MESHTFTAAVRGYHYYQRFWWPKEIEKLICLHEPRNAFHWFTVKTVSKNGEIVGRLPEEISGLTKYFIDRGASMYCMCSSEYYRHSRSVQGGLELECQVAIKTWATLFQALLTRRYLDSVKDLYVEATEDGTNGILFNFVVTLPPIVVAQHALAKKKIQSAFTTVSRNQDIQEMFTAPK